MSKKIFYRTCVCLIASISLTFSKAHAQTIIDSTGLRIDSATKAEAAIDSVMNLHSPHKASVRSAILPGWGQIYNHSYWKLPIIYGALGTTAFIFEYNLKNYKDLKFAYAARFKAAYPTFDSTDYFKLKRAFQNASISGIKLNRDEVRRDIDYSAMVFAIFWILNIIDASVDAHLKSFDVSPDLGLRFKAGYSDIARTNGVSLILQFK